MLRNKALPDDLHDREWDQDADESPMLNLKIGKVSLMKFRQSVFCTKSTQVSNLFDIITKLHRFTLIFFLSLFIRYKIFCRHWGSNRRTSDPSAFDAVAMPTEYL